MLGSCESHSGVLKQCPGRQSPLLWLDVIGLEPGTVDLWCPPRGIKVEAVIT